MQIPLIVGSLQLSVLVEEEQSIHPERQFNGSRWKMAGEEQSMPSDYRKQATLQGGNIDRRSLGEDRRSEKSKEEDDDVGHDACPEVSNLNFETPNYEIGVVGSSLTGGSGRTQGLVSGSTKGSVGLDGHGMGHGFEDGEKLCSFLGKVGRSKLH